MNHDDVGLRVRRPKCVRDRVLTARTAGNDPQRLRATEEITGRIVDERLRQRHDHLVDRRVSGEQRDAPLEDRAPADLHELLGPRASEPKAVASRRHDRRHVHQTIMPLCLASTAALTIAWTRSASIFGVVNGRRLDCRRLNRIVDDQPTSAGSVRSRPFGITARVPMMATGTIGSCASIARRKLPALKRATRPSALLVPSA